MSFFKYFLLLIIVASFFVLGIVVYRIPGVSESIALATTIKPETFTELYIENHTKLPRSTEINTARTFSFTIHNLEYKTMTYPYEVYIEDIDGNKAEILKDIVKLDHDQKKTIPVYYQLNIPLQRAKVVVNLIGKKQQIHYWIGNEPGEKASSASAENEEKGI